MSCLFVTNPLPKDCSYNAVGIKSISLYPPVGYSEVSPTSVSVTEVPIPIEDFLKTSSIVVEQVNTPNGMDKTATFTLIVPKPTAEKEAWVYLLGKSRKYYLQYTDNNGEEWIMIDAQTTSIVYSNPENSYTITIVSKLHYNFLPPETVAKAYLNVAYTEGYS